MTLQRTVLALAGLSLTAAACSGGAPGDPRVAASVAFDESKLIDVLPPDAIRSIDDPTFEPAGRAQWLARPSPVLAFEHDGVARAYPLGILNRHEIVNDVVAGTPVAVTYCPLCNSAVVYERTVAGRTLTFGVSGKLYLSDLVMFDRETDTLWPQIEGLAVRGELRGTELVPLPSSIVAFGEFLERYPRGQLLSRPTGSDYDANPYVGYDTGDGPNPGFFAGEIDDRLPAMERVVGVAVGEDARAYPYSELERVRAINDRVGGTEVVVLWGGVATSALDRSAISEGRHVGSSGVFVPEAAGRSLTFERRGSDVVDRQTSSTWSHLGRATDGPLAGAELQPLHHLDAFWFAWSSFVPFTDVWP